MGTNQTVEWDKTIIASVGEINEEDFLLVEQLNLLFVLSGYVEIMRNGSDIVIRTGDIFILNKGDIVRAVGSEENTTLTITFLYKEYHHEFPTFTLNRPLSMVYKKDAYEQIRNCMASLFIEMSYPAAGTDYIMEGYVKRLIGLLFRHCQMVEKETKVHSISDKVKEVMSYINQNYAEKLSLDEMAEQFYSSKYYLAHSFKKQLGVTIGNYIKEVRLFHSVRMLESSNEKVVTIALSNGFPSVRSFNEAFKKRYNVTPAQFREQRQYENKHHEHAQLSKDIFALLSPFVSLGEFYDASPINLEQIEIQIDTQKPIRKYRKQENVLKSKAELDDHRLREIHQRLGVKWVSVGRIFQKLDMRWVNGTLDCSFQELDRILQSVIFANMLPYFQFQAIDFDDWQEMGLGDNTLFLHVFTQLKYHLQQNYPNSHEWIYEFRCFYEFQNGGKLCQPLVPVISLFKGYPYIFIHFPTAPKKEVVDENDYIYWIDDYTSLSKISLETALSHLYSEEHIQVISKNHNLKGQNKILAWILDFERDSYLQKYIDLALANTSIWGYIGETEIRNYFYPLLLDGEKPFEYFPDELAGKLSLCTPDGRYKENWYAIEFKNRLFEEIVYQNDACIVTKRQENYRLLTIYPEEELLFFMNLKEKEDSETTWRKAKSPFIHIKLNFLNMNGTYRVVKQELTPDLIDKRSDIENLRNCKKLSIDDIAYWNAVNRPARSVEVLEVKETHAIELEVPLFGMVMIDLEKVDD